VASARASLGSVAVTSQGHAYAQFQRALKTGNPRLALDAARELQHINLEDRSGSSSSAMTTTGRSPT
jgi:hypothetical protein